MTRFLDANRYPLRLKTLWLVLAVGGELFLERRQFGEGRIGIDRTVALARAGAGGILPVRGPALAAALVAIAPAFVAATLVAPALVAIAAELALVPVLAFALALEALAGRAALVLARFARGRAIRRGCRGAFGRRDRCAVCGNL